MVDTFRALVARQFEAVLCTLNRYDFGRRLRDAKSHIYWLPFARAELYVYNIRHIRHHAAQLILRLKSSADMDVPWARSGWRA